MRDAEEFFKNDFGIDLNKELKAMTREQLLHTISLLTAVSQGKTLQQSPARNGVWADVQIEVGFPNPILMTHSEQFRVKPEPKYREWKLEEFPVGAVARRTHKSLNQTPQVIVGADLLSINTREVQPACAIMQFESKEYTTATHLLKSWEWKWAHEDDLCWRPCGAVEVS
jgi:hypothetical protein